MFLGGYVPGYFLARGSYEVFSSQETPGNDCSLSGLGIVSNSLIIHYSSSDTQLDTKVKNMVYHNTCFTIFCIQSVGLCRLISKMKTVKEAKIWVKRDTTLLLMSTSFVCVSEWLPVCLLLSATFDVCCFTFMYLSFQPKCVYRSQKKRWGGGESHQTRTNISSSKQS